MADAEEVNFVTGGAIEAPARHRDAMASDDVKSVLSARQAMAVSEQADTSSLTGAQYGVFPDEVWKRILSNMHPFELVRISTTARFILDLLRACDEVLRYSRNKHMPELPAPIPKLSEWDMLNLFYGSGCKMCQTTEATTCWSFRTRLCRNCLLQNSKTEYKLGPPSDGTRMLDTVPFGMIDHNDNWVPNPADYKPHIGLTKIFWIGDIEKGYFDKLSHRGDMPDSLEVQLNSVLEGVRRLEDAEKRIRARSNPEVVENTGRVMEIESDELKPKPDGETDSGNHISDIPLVDLRPDNSTRPKAQNQTASYPHNSQQGPSIAGNSSVKREYNHDQKKGALARQGYNYSRESEPVSLPHVHLSSYADDVSARWIGNISPSSAARFAVEVIRHARERFIGQKPMGRYRLTLDDLKWLFDNKIKPLVRPHVPSMELFLCNQCPTNPRRWIFEPLIQHWCAKHNPIRGGKHAKVDWKQDWPAVGPFRADPPEGASAHSVVAEHRCGEDKSSYRVNEERQPNNGAKNQYGNTHLRHDGKSAPYANGHHKRESIGEKEMAHKINMIVEDAWETWVQFGDIKGLQPSARLFAVITKAARKFQTRFAEELLLSFFLRALIEHPLLQPLRNVANLECLECFKRQDKWKPGNPGKIIQYNLEDLCKHFRDVHVGRLKPSGPVDWSREMIRLPAPRNISGLLEGDQPYAEARGLLEDIFPWAFASHALQGKRGKYRAAPYNYESRKEERAPHHGDPRHHKSFGKAPRPENSHDRSEYGSFSLKGPHPEHRRFDARREDSQHGGGKHYNRAGPSSAEYGNSDRKLFISNHHSVTRSVGHNSHQGATVDTAATRPMVSPEYPLTAIPHPEAFTSDNSRTNHTPRRPSRPSAADFMSDDERREHRSVENSRHDYSSHRAPHHNGLSGYTASHPVPRNPAFRARSRSPPPAVSSYHHAPPIVVPPVPPRMDYPHEAYGPSSGLRHMDYAYPKYAGMYYAQPPPPPPPAVTPDDYRMAYRSRAEGVQDYYGTGTHARAIAPPRHPDPPKDPRYPPPPPPSLLPMAYLPPPYPGTSRPDPRYEQERERFERDYYARRAS